MIAVKLASNKMYPWLRDINQAVLGFQALVVFVVIPKPHTLAYSIHFL